MARLPGAFSVAMFVLPALAAKVLTHTDNMLTQAIESLRLEQHIRSRTDRSKDGHIDWASFCPGRATNNQQAAPISSTSAFGHAWQL